MRSVFCRSVNSNAGEKSFVTMTTGRRQSQRQEGARRDQVEIHRGEAQPGEGVQRPRAHVAGAPEAGGG